MESLKKLGEILLEMGCLTKEQLDEALIEQINSKQKLGEILVGKNILTPRQVTEALGLQFMFPVVNPSDYLGNIAAINSLPKELIEHLEVFPLELQNNGAAILIAISDPLNFAIQVGLRSKTPLDVKFALATKESIQAALSALTAPATVPVSEPAAPEPVTPEPVVQEPVPVSAEPEVPSAPELASAVPASEPAQTFFPDLDEFVTVSEPAAPSVIAQPAAVQPATVQPEPAAPQTLVPLQPAEAQAVPVQPVIVQPAAVQPAAAQPEPAAPQTLVLPQPAAAQAVPVPPVIAQPAAVQPKAVQPEPVAPKLVLSQAAEAYAVPVQPVIARPAAVQPDVSETGETGEQLKLGDILLQAGAITEIQLLEALQKQKYTGSRLGEVLLADKILTESRLAEALSTQLRLPMFTLNRYRPMTEAIKSVPRYMAERLNLIPLSIVEGDLLLIAMANPLDLIAQDEVRMATGHDLKIGITTESEIRNNLDRLYNLQGNLEDAIVEVLKDGAMAEENLIETGASADDAPIIQLVNNVLEQAVREGASDVHVEPFEKNARIRYRVDGALYNAFDYPVGLHPAVSARMKIMASMDIAEKRKPQDGRILIKTGGRRIDLRVSSLPTMNGEKMVLRILDQESSAVGLERLGLEDDDMEKIDVFCNTPWGIMLVTGPTGSGKSTTLYSILQKINKPDVNIITVEDPVEFTVPGINQVHVNEKAGLTFESALRSILRQDPDKVMVGEIRDQKTAQIAIRAALTGHFVLSTLHTNDAPSAATRMVDMGVPPFLVSASLSGVIAQRLVRKLCPFCREEYEMLPTMCDALEIPHGTRAWKPKGCNECRNGYKGRKGIYEIMMVDDDLRGMILEGVSNIALRAEAIKKGMKTLRKSGISNALAGFTSIEEVFSSTL